MKTKIIKTTMKIYKIIRKIMTQEKYQFKIKIPKLI